MAFELKEGQGSLFDNRDKKRKYGNPRIPDYTGTIKINGQIMEIAAWNKEHPRGDFYSVQVSEKRPRGATAGLPRADEPPVQQTPAPAPPAPPAPPADDGSDIPF